MACRLDVGGEVDEHIVHLVPDTTQQIAAAVDLQAVYTYDVADADVRVGCNRTSGQAVRWTRVTVAAEEADTLYRLSL